MEGYSLKRRLADLLGEAATSSFLNDRTTYDYLYDAAKDFNKRTHFLTNVQSLAVSALTGTYNLNADYVALALSDEFNRPFIKYTVNGTDYFIYSKDYQDIVLANDTSQSDVPQFFSITDAPQLQPLSGTASSVGASANGECTLTDSTAPFGNVSPGDYVHNLTDGSDGIVIAQTSSSQIVCALFGGTNNDWSLSDGYVVVPQARFQIIFTPMPSAVATASITYVVRPAPVYSLYRAYKMPPDAELPLCLFAASKYKQRDREPMVSQAYMQEYEMFTMKAAKEYRRGNPARTGYSVNLDRCRNKRSTGSGGWR